MLKEGLHKSLLNVNLYITAQIPYKLRKTYFYIYKKQKY